MWQDTIQSNSCLLNDLQGRIKAVDKLADSEPF